MTANGDKTHEYNHINQYHFYSHCNSPNIEDKCIMSRNDNLIYERIDLTSVAKQIMT